MTNHRKPLFPSLPDLNRRSFLKLGAAAPVALSASSLTALPFADAWASVDIPSSELRFLEPGDVTILTALIPIVLAGALPATFGSEDMAEIIRRIDGSLDRLAPYIKGELRLLLNLMDMAPVRALLARVWSPWETATEYDLDAFLGRWRDSSIPQLRSAYAALHEMITSAWYGESDSWGRIGYAGPPDVERPIGEDPA